MHESVVSATDFLSKDDAWLEVVAARLGEGRIARLQNSNCNQGNTKHSTWTDGSYGFVRQPWQVFFPTELARLVVCGAHEAAARCAKAIACRTVFQHECVRDRSGTKAMTVSWR
ncbi:MAG: hypothetical protein ACK55I_05850, partial [bacterium]